MSLTKHALAVGRVAGGNHLSAAQDEPEPIDRGPVTEPAELTEADWLAVDLEGNEDKANRRVAADVRIGVEDQLIEFRARGWV